MMLWELGPMQKRSSHAGSILCKEIQTLLIESGHTFRLYPGPSCITGMHWHHDASLACTTGLSVNHTLIHCIDNKESSTTRIRR